MKKYILFGLTLLMAFPVYVSAQEDDTEDEAEVAVRVIKKKQKEYTTREVRGRVLNATSLWPVRLFVPTVLTVIVR